jgi:BRCA1/BRCA2-containing complex subunit 3
MSVDTVFVTKEVYSSCLHHAMTTEKEEIMGLLLGDIDGSTALIWSFIVQVRSDKRKDRVEVSSEQLVQAMSRAEELSKKIGKNSRVVGWYHSHPHITCPPSHVDLRTQFNFQQMDQGFIGLIFSVFDAPNDPVERGYHHRSELRGFQAKEKRGASGLVEKVLRVHVQQSNYHIFEMSIEMRKVLEKWCWSELVGMVEKMFEEEKATYLHHLAKYSCPVTRSQCRHIYQQALLRLTQDCVHPFIAAFQYSLTFKKLSSKLLEKTTSESVHYGTITSRNTPQKSLKRRRSNTIGVSPPKRKRSPSVTLSHSRTISLSVSPKRTVPFTSPKSHSSTPRRSTSRSINCHVSPRRSPRRVNSQEKNASSSLKSWSELNGRKSQEEELPEYPISIGGRSGKSGTQTSLKLILDDSLLTQETLASNIKVVSKNLLPNENNTNISSNSPKLVVFDSKVEDNPKVLERSVLPSSKKRKKKKKKKKKKIRRKSSGNRDISSLSLSSDVSSSSDSNSE